MKQAIFLSEKKKGEKGRGLNRKTVSVLKRKEEGRKGASVKKITLVRDGLPLRKRERKGEERMSCA